MNKFIFGLIIVFLADFASAADFVSAWSQGKWLLSSGVTGTGKTISTYDTAQACHAAGDALAKGVKKAPSYACKALDLGVYTLAPVPAPIPPKPADESQTLSCPTGSTGSWVQTRTYQHVDGSIQYWTPTVWMPLGAPASSCKINTTHPGLQVDPASFPPPAIGSSQFLVIPVPRDEKGEVLEPYRPVASDIGAFRTNCLVSHTSFDDPIVFPGAPNGAHGHTFSGNDGANAFSTAENILKGQSSGCFGGIANRTIYWSPLILDLRDHKMQDPRGGTQIYYKTGYNGVRNEDVTAPPTALRMIAGSSNGTPNNPSEAGNFTCDLSNGGSANGWKTIPDCKANSYLQFEVDFPQCWDGVNLDSPNHKDHMAYAATGYITQSQLDARINSGGPLPAGFQNLGQQWFETITPTQACPPSHPVAIPLITYRIYYWTGSEEHATTHWALASDMYLLNDPKQYWKYTTQNKTGEFSCNNDTFGDPIIGQPKSCYSMDSNGNVIKFLGNEGTNLKADVSTIVAYGSFNVGSGFSSHADWFNGWEPEIIKTFVTYCLNRSMDCHSQVLGDGRTLDTPPGWH